MSRIVPLVPALAVALLVSPGAADTTPPERPASEWRQWRGPQRDGHVVGDAWPGDLSRLERVWRVELGKGYPGPLIAADRVFVVESVDDATVGVRALDRQTGKSLWTARWPGAGEVPFFARDNGDWVRSTPAYDGETLYVGDMDEVIVALDGATGEERWRVDVPARFGTGVPPFGFASSPLVADGALYVQAADSLLRLDPATGATVWRSLVVDEPGMAASGAFSSPILTTLAGRRQLVVLTRAALHGVDPDDGTVLWSQDVPSFRGMHIQTPLAHGDGIVTSPYRERTFRFDVGRTESGHEVSQRWESPATGYMSSPVLVDDHVYMHLGNGRFGCIRASDGEIAWRTTERFGPYWSLVGNGDLLLALDARGTLRLIRADPAGFALLDEVDVDADEAWAHLAVAGRDVVVRGLESVTLWRWRDP